MKILYNVYIYADGEEKAVVKNLEASEAMARVLDNADHGLQCLVERAGSEEEEE